MEQEKCSDSLGAIKGFSFKDQFFVTAEDAVRCMKILAKESKKAEKKHPFAKYIRKSK
jgi:hypothetical protein